MRDKMANDTRVIPFFFERISTTALSIRRSHMYAVSVRRRVYSWNWDEGSRLTELKSPRLLPTCGFPAAVARSADIRVREREKKGTLFVVLYGYLIILEGWPASRVL